MAPSKRARSSSATDVKSAPPAKMAKLNSGDQKFINKSLTGSYALCQTLNYELWRQAETGTLTNRDCRKTITYSFRAFAVLMQRLAKLFKSSYSPLRAQNEIYSEVSHARTKNNFINYSGDHESIMRATEKRLKVYPITVSLRLDEFRSSGYLKQVFDWMDTIPSKYFAENTEKNVRSLKKKMLEYLQIINDNPLVYFFDDFPEFPFDVRLIPLEDESYYTTLVTGIEDSIRTLGVIFCTVSAKFAGVPPDYNPEDNDDEPDMEPDYHDYDMVKIFFCLSKKLNTLARLLADVLEEEVDVICTVEENFDEDFNAENLEDDNEVIDESSREL